MKEYLGGHMLPEEIHAAETHIASCPLCNMALEGFEAHTDEALEAIAGLNSGFLKEHFDAITPQIHLNSIAPAVTSTAHSRKRTAVFPFLKLTSVAAALLVGFGIFWLLDRSKNNTKESGLIAGNEAILEQSNTAGATANDKAMSQYKAGKEVKPAKTDQAQAAPSAAARNTEATPKPAAEAAAIPGTQNKEAVKTKDNSEQLAYNEEEGQQRKAAWASTDSANRSRRSVAALTDNNADEAKNMTVAMKPQRPPTAVPEPAALSMKKEAAADEGDIMTSADELYGEGNYRAAVTKYTRAMKTGDKSSRAEATVMAAKCYRNMGDKARAIALLQELVDKDGPQRNTARRLLEELNDK